MATREKEGPRGELRLYYENEESASTHRDQGRSARLLPSKDESVELVIESWDSNAIKQTRDGSKSVYEIPVKDLIRLIKENGRKK